MSEPKRLWYQMIQDTLKIFWNPTKDRRESWRRSRRGNREWLLWDAMPARVWYESFMGGADFRVATFGLGLDHDWCVNGNGAPAAANFVATNQIGGGLTLQSDANADRWLALHTGSSYPVAMRVSPHLFVLIELTGLTDSWFYVGLVGSSNLETGNNNPWTVPDDGVWIEYDTNTDTNLRFITRSGAAQTLTSLGTFTLGDHSVCFQSNDAGTEVKLLYDGVLVATHTTTLPTVQLKPLFLSGTRENVAKELILRDLRLVYDRLAY